MARSRELRVVISGDQRGLERAFTKAGAGAQQLERRIGRASTGIGRGLATAAKVGTVALGAGLVGALKGSIDAFAEAERVAAQTNAVLKSTGGVAEVSAKQIGDLATAISKKSGMDDEAIQSGENLLLTFTNIRNESGKGNDIFSQTVGIMADLSTALGQDTKNSAIQLGKALNDPVRGVTALRRVGVSFTKEQQDQIKTLVDSGKTLDAQKLILRELRKEFGGAAAAAGDTFSGKINKAKVSLGNLGEAIGGVVAPALGTAADKLAGFVDKLASSDRPAKFFAGLKGRADDAKRLFSNLFQDISKRRTQGASLGASIGGAFVSAVGDIDWSAVGEKIKTGFETALKGIKVAGTFGGDFANSIAAGINQAVGSIDGRKLLGGLLDVVSEALDALFSPSFWAEHFAAILSIVTVVIPVGKILKLPGFSVLYNLLSKQLFRAAAAVGKGLASLFGRAGSQAFTEFLAQIERFAPRVAQGMLAVATGGVGALRSFPGKVAGEIKIMINLAADAIGEGAGRTTAAMVRLVVRAVATLGKGAVGAGEAAGKLVAAIFGKFDDLTGGVPSRIAKGLAAGTSKIRDWVGNFASAALGIGKGIVSSIVKGMGSLGHAILSKITGALDWVKQKAKDVAGFLNPFGDGIGKKITRGIVGGVSAGGAVGAASQGGSGALMGADKALSPFAAIGARAGLHVSSGKRAAGGRTVSGGISYHGSGEAIDLANGVGPDSAKLGVFRTLKSRFGSRLAELIYTPGGQGIKNGRPFTYTGAVAADHYDHVHVALDLGRPGPGIGDGPGKRRFIGDGKGRLTGAELAADAARKAGFRGSDLVTMVAIAGRESQWNPRATNFKYPDHSIGLWQINQLAHKGRFGSDSQLMDPYRNARAAYTLFKESGLMPWSTRNSYQGFVNQARAAVIASRGDAPARSTRGASAHRSTGGTGWGGQSWGSWLRNSPSFEEQTAAADLAIAEATPGGDTPVGGSAAALGLAAADRSKRLVINKRIRKIRAALKKKGLRPATRVRLQNELGDLIGQSRGLLATEQQLRTAPAPEDSGGDPNQPLIDAIQAAAEQQRALEEATRQHTDALDGVRAEIKRQTDFGQSVQATESFQLKKMLADVVAGGVGAMVGQRALTPGIGTVAAYAPSVF